jgi:hypothetical protein
MATFSIVLLLCLVLLGIVIITELFAPDLMKEGFANLPRTTYWATFAAPRSDIGPFGPTGGPSQEDSSYIRDPRYFADYTDVSRIGASYDFCRMIAPADDPKNYFFACALAGTEGLDSTKFRTMSTKDGFRISYDDYMRDVNGDGRNDYCRILKWKDGSYEPVCQRATDIGFDSKETVDSDPPEDIVTLLTFYQQCGLWLRFMSDMKDTMDAIKVKTSGGLTIDETPKRDSTEGLQFNGIDQFLRVYDSSDLSLGINVPLRSIRAWMVWVYFDEFTNNAKIFDFGNGKAKDNVFLGILGKGDPPIGDDGRENPFAFGKRDPGTEGGAELRPMLCGTEDSTVPTGPSGAQPVKEMSPQHLLQTTDANVDEYTCSGFEEFPRRLGPSVVGTTLNKKTGRASLLYEVWDKQARKMRIKVNNSIPLGKWTHITITATNNDAFRPNISVYVNAKLVLQKENGFLPSTGSMTNCYLGKSNWSNGVSQYENRDELFKGRLFDFRAYKTALSTQLIEESYDWGKAKLAL